MEELTDKHLFFEPIEINNCSDCCGEQYCGNNATQYTKINLNGIIILVMMCDKHAEMLQK